MSDVPADLIEQAAKALCKIRCIHWEPQKPERLCRTNDGLARAVLGAIDLPGLLNAAKAEAWDEGAGFASPYSGGYRRSLFAQNPYRPEEGNDRG